MKRKNALLVILLCCGFFWRLAFAWRPMEELTAFPVVDDGFYSLNIARNIAAGKGMTCDGIHPTNGFQPLYVFLSVPFYWLFPQDRQLPVHLVLSCLSLLSVFTGYLIFKLLKLITDEEAALFAVVLWALSPTVLEFELNGLETGMNVFFMAGGAYYYLLRIRHHVPPLRHCLILGLWLGLLALTRIDSLFWCAAMFFDYLWTNRRCLSRVVRPALAVIGASAVISSPWFLNNLINFGHLMPLSGKAVRQISLATLIPGFYSAPDPLIPWSYYQTNLAQSLRKMGRAPLVEAIFWPGLFLGRAWLGYLLLVSLAGAGAALCLRRRERFNRYCGLNEVQSLNFSLAYCLIMLLAYCFYVFGQWYYVRYYFPILFVSVLYSAIAYDLLVNHLLKERAAKAVNICLACFLLCTFNYRLLERYRTGNTFDTHARQDYYGVAGWIREHLPREAVIGAFQTGTIAYFLDNRVINLDGVVNKDAFYAIKEKRMLNYVENSGIDYLMDWPGMIDSLLWKMSPAAADRSRLRLLEEHPPGYEIYQVVKE